jgi:hypothetical protein
MKAAFAEQNGLAVESRLCDESVDSITWRLDDNLVSPSDLFVRPRAMGRWK